MKTEVLVALLLFLAFQPVTAQSDTVTYIHQEDDRLLFYEQVTALHEMMWKYSGTTTYFYFYPTLMERTIDRNGEVNHYSHTNCTYCDMRFILLRCSNYTSYPVDNWSKFEPDSVELSYAGASLTDYSMYENDTIGFGTNARISDGVIEERSGVSFTLTIVSFNATFVGLGRYFMAIVEINVCFSSLYYMTPLAVDGVYTPELGLVVAASLLGVFILIITINDVRKARKKRDEDWSRCTKVALTSST